MNSLQKIGVDFANKYEIPIEETVIRPKGGLESLKEFQALPEYAQFGGMKHYSYYPSIQPQLGKPRKVTPKFDMITKSLEWRTPDGPVDTGIYAKTSMKQGDKTYYDIYDKGELILQHVLDDPDEMPLSKVMQSLVTDFSGQPSKMAVREISIGQSPLSQFGLRPDLHKRCNVFGAGHGACKICEGCESFVKKGEFETMERTRPK